MLRRPLALLTTAALLLTGCGDGDSASDGVHVVVTTTVVADVVGAVLEEAGVPATVEVLMPPGADPHGYAPSAADVRAMADAELVIAIGLGLEEGLVDTFEQFAAGDGPQVLELAPHLQPLPYAGGHGDDEHDDEGVEADADHDDEDDADHGDGGQDPHVWLDPVRVARMAELVADGLALTVAGAQHDAALQEAGDVVAARFEALADELATQLAVIPTDRRQLVTNHDAFGYFAQRFELDVIATVLPGSSTDAEPSAQDFRELIEVVTAAGVTAVFSEPETSDRIAQALADEVAGLRVVELYAGSLGPEGSGAETLEGLLRTNAQRIVDALG